MKLYDALSNRRWRQDGPYDGTRRIESRALADELAALYRRQDTAMGRWAEGYGRIRHSGLTQLQLRGMADLLAARGLRGWPRPG